MAPSEDHAWVPETCTLPTVERPLRLAEFDDLFAIALRGQQRLSPTKLSWELDPASEVAARGLAAQEGSCCSFFSFVFRPGDGTLRMDIEVPAVHVSVLDALASRAAAGMRT